MSRWVFCAKLFPHCGKVHAYFRLFPDRDWGSSTMIEGRVFAAGGGMYGWWNSLPLWVICCNGGSDCKFAGWEGPLAWIAFIKTSTSVENSISLDPVLFSRAATMVAGGAGTVGLGCGPEPCSTLGKGSLDTLLRAFLAGRMSGIGCIDGGSEARRTGCALSGWLGTKNCW